MFECKVGAYLRLSKDDFENKESNSISNQKELINNYIQSNNDFNIIDYYVDDGYSGTNFNRPGFKRMIQDITNNKINTVIVKDLSRLGRNHIEVDNYLENIFPLYNTRFISVTENIDLNEKCASLDNISIPIKSLINDLYAKDISDKVRTTLKVKKKNGEFVGVSAPYGYIKDPDDKHKFLIDIESSDIVTKIFNMVLLGKSRKEIADYLNNKGILTPSLYKTQKEKTNNTKNVVSNKWNAEIVTRILRNETYTGTLIQGVKKKLNYRTNKIIDVSKENWIITYNHHKPIISKENFEKVQQILNRKKGYFKNNDIYASYLKCADCGKSMILKKSKDKEYYYCSSFIRNGNCTNHSIRKDRLGELVFYNIKEKYSNMEFNKISDSILNDYIDKIVVYNKDNIKITYKYI